MLSRYYDYAAVGLRTEGRIFIEGDGAQVGGEAQQVGGSFN